ncbi:MAG: RluA family pseudouridine synthase [Christensenellales bacterium]|jgi:23S rRNA pseudouridine1911/1915/1917 synthase
MCREHDEEVLVVQEGGERLDVFIANNAEGITRSFAQNLIKKGDATVNGAVQKANYRLKAGQIVRLVLPEPEIAELVPEDIPLDVVYEDADIIVVNKPVGMVVHPAPGNPSGTLANALLFRIKDLEMIGDELRPGIVHRIDKDTSGLLVVAKNEGAMRSLSDQIRERTAGREYLALVDGVISKDEGTIRAPIARHPKDRKKMAVVQGGREATTHYSVLARFPADENGASGSGNTLVVCALETGRTHQIRVHMAHIGHPVTGDGVYGAAKNKLGFTGQALHAFRLHLKHPKTGEPMTFCAPLPEVFSAALTRLNGGRMPPVEEYKEKVSLCCHSNR